MTTRRLLIVRHGRTRWNAERRFQGQADPPLDEVGVAQAHEAGEVLAALAPQWLVSSDAVRAARTAQIIGRACELAVHPDARLRERALGSWEGLTREQVAARYPDQFADWIAGRDVSGRGGETREQVAQRAGAVLDSLPQVPTTVLVTHSATAMALTNLLLDIRQAVHPLGSLANCHWSELVVETPDPLPADPDATPRWRLHGHNLGAPGAVVPMPVRRLTADEGTDADA